MIPVGHIFPKGRIIRQIDFGKWLVEIFYDSNPTEVILKKYNPPRIFKRGDELANLVVIGQGDKYCHVVLDEYMDALIDYFYIKDYPVLKKNRPEWALWHRCWRKDCSKEFVNNFSVEELSIKKRYPLLTPFKLKTNDYVLPVFGYRDISFLNGNPLFYPSTFEKGKYIPYCVYKTDDIGYFPKSYSAKLIASSGEGLEHNQEVLVFLHGFTHPAKWHYGVWKHRPWVAKNKKVFSNCKSIPNKSCDEIHCVTDSLFRKIHPIIKNDCLEYLKAIVTLFESNSTKLIKISDRVNEECKEIVVGCLDNILGKREFQIFYGICHNWADQNPVFHLNPVTMYMTDKEPEIKCDNRSKIIFDGSLIEVKANDKQ